jgi:hypothetical protein
MHRALEYKIAKLTMCKTQSQSKKAVTTSSVGQHGPPTNAEVGSGAAEE